ncbi:MAG: PmoA family protein [Opitutaceae bacterium]|nr:PmoA family protein [Opitutaceae bacterium]MBP9913337.1 PmoA family protein [Opitutaceae bacterium]
MNALRLQHDLDSAVSLFHGDRLLCRYVYLPTTAAKESPKPYFHPVNSFAGDTLTNFRPNDHPWHHALSFTLNNVSGANFWGGPTCLQDGYKWRDDHGMQQHLAWTKLAAAGATATLAHRLAWRRLEETFFTEERSIEVTVDEPAQTWRLHWRSRLTNTSGRTLTLGNPASNGGLKGSHYSGLQFRGARELLDDHLDPTIKIVAEGGHEGIEAVHGKLARWMEWHGQLDETLQRVIIRFENNTGPLHWFVRRNYPLAACPLQFEQNLDIAAGADLVADHTLTFTSSSS